MEEFCNLILVALFTTNSLDKAESVKVKLEETPAKTFDEIFGEGWQNKDEAEDLKTPPTNFGQNVHHQIDRQNIINKFHAMKEEFKQKKKYSKKEWVQIEDRIAKHLKVNRSKIYEWKKEFGLSRKVVYEKEERKHLIEKFDQMKAELKRAGIKNSYHQEIDKTVAKELGLNFTTIYAWKSELGLTAPTHKYSHSEQKELMKRYYEIKDKNPPFIDEDIARILKIGSRTLCNWKRQFKRQQFHQNSVDGHSVDENASSNVQEIENSNLESI